MVALSAGWPILDFFFGTKITEAAPPFEHFEGWVPRTMVSGLGERYPSASVRTPGDAENDEKEVEGRGGHLSKTTKGGAASVVIVSTVKTTRWARPLSEPTFNKCYERAA